MYLYVYYCIHYILLYVPGNMIHLSLGYKMQILVGGYDGITYNISIIRYTRI